jgi:tRNA nucleotidyltransferase/poly(A) polymerase
MMKLVKEYLVGGAVRDKVMHEILGTPLNSSYDIDIAVEAASYDEMRNHIIATGGDIKQESPQFFTIRALTSYKGQRRPIDYTLCRKEGDYKDGRHPEKVEIGTIEEDLARRDLTINAMAIDLATDKLIDPYGGREDIQQRVIRCCGDVETRCDEDYLRVLRILRFSITLGFKITPDTETILYHPRYIQELFNTVSDERIREEFTKMFKHDTNKTLDALFEYPLIRRQMVKLLWLRPTF